MSVLGRQPSGGTKPSPVFGHDAGVQRGRVARHWPWPVSSRCTAAHRGPRWMSNGPQSLSDGAFAVERRVARGISAFFKKRRPAFKPSNGAHAASSRNDPTNARNQAIRRVMAVMAAGNSCALARQANAKCYLLLVRTSQHMGSKPYQRSREPKATRSEQCTIGAHPDSRDRIHSCKKRESAPETFSATKSRNNLILAGMIGVSRITA